MTLPDILQKHWASSTREPTRALAIREDGIALGKTLVAPWKNGRLAIDEERIIALLSVTFCKHIPRSVIKSFRHAERCWRAGNKVLADTHLALSGIQTVDVEKAQRLFAAEWGVKKGVTIDQLYTFAGLRKDDGDDDSEDDDDSDEGDENDNSDEGDGDSGFDSKHPRWPGGTPGDIGGKFRPKDEDATVPDSIVTSPQPASTDTDSSSWYDRNKGWLVPAATVAIGAAAVALAIATVGAAIPEEAEAAAALAETEATGTEAAATAEELGTEPKTNIFRQAEADTGSLLQEEVPSLRRSPDSAYDWVDAEGNTYDGVGPPPSQYFNAPSFNRSIGDHLLTQGLDNVVVNINGLTAEQQAAVETYISRLPLSEQGHIILFK